AALLAQKFWPGSLTLILPKSPAIPDAVTAGNQTVGLRVPAHPIALALLRAAEIPIAAPSANRSTQISPTIASHVLRGLDGRIDLLLDAGPTPGGLESTVLDLTTNPPQILRPGLVTVDQLQAVIGKVAAPEHTISSATEALRSPGQLARHYAPTAKVICLTNESDAENKSTILNLLNTKKRIGWLRLPDSAIEFDADPTTINIIDMPPDAAAYSSHLYAALHELDHAGVDYIVVDLPPTGDAWLAVHDRLRRAASSD
ncbi:MAG TPA: L-threonylcarbamoyladenylate synthase, partial [Pirellulales bacterium]